MGTYTNRDWGHIGRGTYSNSDWGHIGTEAYRDWGHTVIGTGDIDRDWGHIVIGTLDIWGLGTYRNIPMFRVSPLTMKPTFMLVSLADGGI